MPPKGSKSPRGAQRWVLDELRALRPGDRLSTAQIAKRIGKASKKSYHKNSVYNALRLMVRQGAIEVVRKGRQKTYRIPGARGNVDVRSPAPKLATTPRPDVPAGALSSILPHKLAVGDILVMHIGETDVLTATNLHGRLVLERHPLPD
ncbi:MAG: helix-turn-helix domain-containing protein [Thermoplasmata archaeon]|nr:helix-turn-helix domain-containing protein [Thermoplasmata archaeon]